MNDNTHAESLDLRRVLNSHLVFLNMFLSHQCLRGDKVSLNHFGNLVDLSFCFPIKLQRWGDFLSEGNFTRNTYGQNTHVPGVKSHPLTWPCGRIHLFHSSFRQPRQSEHEVLDLKPTDVHFIGILDVEKYYSYQAHPYNLMLIWTFFMENVNLCRKRWHLVQKTNRYMCERVK